MSFDAWQIAIKAEIEEFAKANGLIYTGTERAGTGTEYVGVKTEEDIDGESEYVTIRLSDHAPGHGQSDVDVYMQINEGWESQLQEVKDKITDLTERYPALPVPAKQKPAEQQPAGPPAIDPSQAKPGEKAGITSSRQAMVNADRADAGLSTINSPERHKWETARKEALDQGIPDKALRIATEILQSPRALSDVETAGFSIKMQMLKTEHHKLSQEAKAMETAGDEVGADLKYNEAGRVIQELDVITEADLRSGTEKGRSLAAQKLTVNQDYDLASVLVKARIAKKSKLSSQQEQNFETLTGQLEESTERIDQLEKKVDDLVAKQAIKTNHLTRKKATQAVMDTELESLYKKAERLLKEGCYAD
jgi:hypothetical protein